jgi:site-specific recombinase XerD
MKTTKIDWYAVMVRKLQLGGKSERTVQAYTRAVHQLTTHYKKDPEFITEEELEAYFLYRRNESEWAPKTLNLCYCGIKFYYQYVLHRDWKLLTILKAQKEERLPEIPSKETIQRVLSCVTTFHNFVFFSTVYACGLRLQEALHLQISDIDGKRLMLYIHLLEQGVNIRVIQRYMGHKSLETTMRYLHLTRKGQEDAYQIIDSFMTGFSYDRS